MTGDVDAREVSLERAAVGIRGRGPDGSERRVLSAMAGERPVPGSSLPRRTGMAAAELLAAVRRLTARGMVETCVLHGALHLRLTAKGHNAATVQAAA